MSEDMAEEISAKMISDNDSDKSGGLTVKESGLSDDDFTTLDTDGDGSLTSSELKTGLTSNNQSLSALMPPPPSGVGGCKMGQGMPDRNRLQDRGQHGEPVRHGLQRNPVGRGIRPHGRRVRRA